MGNEIFIPNKRICVKPLRSSLEAIQRLQPPITGKGCRSFVGMVNFLSMFCLEIQKLLKPIYDLTRKGKLFVLGKEQQDSFEEIKCRLIKPQICICLTQLVGFTCIQTQVNLLWAVLFTKFKMDSPN